MSDEIPEVGEDWFRKAELVLPRGALRSPYRRLGFSEYPDARQYYRRLALMEDALVQANYRMMVRWNNELRRGARTARRARPQRV